MRQLFNFFYFVLFWCLAFIPNNHHTRNVDLETICSKETKKPLSSHNFFHLVRVCTMKLHSIQWCGQCCYDHLLSNLAVENSARTTRHNPDPTFCSRARGRIQKKTLCMGPYAGVDYNLTYVHSRVDSNTFTKGNPMPELTLTLCQSRLYPPVRDFGFGLCFLLCIAIYRLNVTCQKILSSHCRHFTAWDRNKEDRKRSS